MNGVTTTFTMNLNTGLPQALGDGTNHYIYGAGRIAQVNTTLEYFLGDTLGSVRQLTSPNGAVTYARSYDPYGVRASTTGSSSTTYGHTSESYGDSTQLLYLRARYYASNSGRFLTQDTWMADYHRPLSLNRWMYAEGNPINNTDPTGNAICYRPMEKSLPTACQNGLAYTYAFARVIKTYVTSGTILPVEGFAMLFDFSKPHFESTRDLMWAVTIVLDDMDANRGGIWQQATGWKGPAESAFYIGLNWLPYLNNPAHNKKPWCDPTNANNCTSEDWPHSLRGDWNQKYWDKTANQAYHFWFYVSVAYFDSLSMANIGDYVHDNPFTLVEYDFIGSPEDEAPPPPTVATRPDKELTQKGISLGWSLRDNDFFEEIPCALNPGFLYTDIGSWIRANLKG